MQLGPKTLGSVRALAVVGGAEIVGKLATLILVVLVARLLGVERFGVFAYGLGLGQLAGALALAGFNVTLIQRGSARPEQLASLLAQVLVLRLLLTAILLAICAFAVLASRPEAAERTTILVLVSASLLEVFTAAYQAACTARKQQGRPAILLALQRVITTALVAVTVILDLGLQGAGASYLAGSAVGLPGRSKR